MVKMIWVKSKMHNPMKKVLYLFSVVALILAACSKELTPVVEDNTIEEAFLTFSSERPQLEPTTRTEWNGSTIIWSTDDKIRAGYTLNGAWMSQSTAATAENPAKLYASGSVAITH